MKRFAVLLLSLALLLAVGCSPSEMTVHMADPVGGTITVSATAGIDMTPDMAEVTVGVTTRGATSQAAREKNTEAINATIEALLALGIEEKDIQTANMYMWPTYADYNNGVITGYQMSMDLRVTVRNVDQAGAVIDAATASGSNSLGGIYFRVSNEGEVYAQALENAVGVARKKADQLAAASGKTVVGVETITEVSYAPVVTNQLSRSSVNPDTAGGGSQMMAGTTTITAQITATFTIQ